jgi:hypothetical protein
VSDADVGHTVRLDVWASNAAGTAQAVQSAPSAVVQARPPIGGGGGGGGGTGSGGGGATISLARIKAGLLKSIAPHGKGARIAALLKKKGYSFSFAALVGGSAQISWYFVPKGAHLSKAKPKPVLVASGRKSFAKAGGAKMTIKLTSKGRKLLKHAKRLKLTGKGAFSVSGGGKVSARKTFTLKR